MIYTVDLAWYFVDRLPPQVNSAAVPIGASGKSRNGSSQKYRMTAFHLDHIKNMSLLF